MIDFFSGMLSAFLFCYSYRRYKAGQKRAAMARHPSNYNLKHEPDDIGYPLRWFAKDPLDMCPVMADGVHKCFWNKVHLGNHVCMCGDEREQLWKTK